MKNTPVIAAALFAGFVGGILGTSVMHIREQSLPNRVIRARSFEVVDEKGRPISYWGVDKLHDVVLAFGGQWDPKRYVERTGDLTDPSNQGAMIGMVGGDATLRFNGADG